MAFEKAWASVLPQAFTSDGTQFGVVTIADTIGFFVKNVVVLNAIGLTPLSLQIKRVLSPTQLIVGPNDNKISPNNFTNISVYTVLLGANISAQEQQKSKIPDGDHYVAVYMPDPVVADRVIPVDPYGNPYGPDNPMPVVFDGTIEASVVEIKGSPSGDLLNVNADGSINVNVVETPIAGQNVKSFYNEVASVASGVETLIVSYTVPIGKTAILQRIDTSGENVGRYNVYLNGSAFDVQRTYFGGDFNALFEYITGTNAGFVLMAGDVVTVKILHTSVFVGNFNGRIQILEIA